MKHLKMLLACALALLLALLLVACNAVVSVVGAKIDENGDLIITISGADQWAYQVINMTSWQYGDTQWSDSDPVVNPTVITVAAGDEIVIMVNGYDAEAPWAAPAAWAVDRQPDLLRSGGAG